jgi:hypothetical protein
MKKIIRLTESDLTRIVRRVINEKEEGETSFDFSQINNKLLSDFFTVKNDFRYLNNHNGMEIYVLKRNGFSVMVAVKPSNEPSKISMVIFLKFPMGKSINYLQEVKGMESVTIPMDDFNGMTRLIQGAVDFGKAQNDYDNLPPLPKY